jgi:hypothetical protein
MIGDNMDLHASGETHRPGLQHRAPSEQGRGFWTAFWQHYLVWANRTIAAASNTYFFAVFREHIGRPLLSDVVIFAYTFVLSELLGRMIERWYKPAFARAGPHQAFRRHDNARLVVSESDFLYRTRAEKSLYETWVMYLLNAGIGVLLCARRGVGYEVIGLGAIGLFASVFTLGGVAVVCSTDFRTGKTSPMAIFFGLILLAPGVGYVAAALTHVGLP